MHLHSNPKLSSYFPKY